LLSDEFKRELKLSQEGGTVEILTQLQSMEKQVFLFFIVTASYDFDFAISASFLHEEDLPYHERQVATVERNLEDKDVLRFMVASSQVGLSVVSPLFLARLYSVILFPFIPHLRSF
jgi:hypothetical protein